MKREIKIRYVPKTNTHDGAVNEDANEIGYRVIQSELRDIAYNNHNLKLYERARCILSFVLLPILQPHFLQFCLFLYNLHLMLITKNILRIFRFVLR